MNVEYANTIPMRKILDKIGISPIAKSDTELLYLSPFCDSHEPKLVIHNRSNTWTDMNNNATGNVIDFVANYLKHYQLPHTVNDATHWLKENIGYAVVKMPTLTKDYRQVDKAYTRIDHQRLRTPHMINYLERVRGIPAKFAKHTLVEVHVRNEKTKKSFLALGLKTDGKSFTIRNEFVKAQLKKPYVSFIRGSNPNQMGLHIFKDVFDYLSAIVMRGGKPFADDVMILNTYRNMPLSAAYIYNYGYSNVYTWLDNTPEGIEATGIYKRYLKTEHGARHRPMNKGYSAFNSLNAWAVHQKQQQTKAGA